MSWEVGAAILVAIVLYVLYRGSVELQQVHWPLKMGLFYSAISLGAVALNIALRMSADGTGSVQVQEDFQTLYGVYVYVLLAAFGYLFIHVLRMIFSWLHRRKERQTEEEGVGEF